MQHSTKPASRRTTLPASIGGPLPRSRREAALLRNSGTRICLSCDKSFKSWGRGNRICKPCAHLHLGTFQRPAYHTVPILDDDKEN